MNKFETTELSELRMSARKHVNENFALVNFAAPGDVHRLYVEVKNGLLQEFLTDEVRQSPEVLARNRASQQAWLRPLMNCSNVLC